MRELTALATVLIGALVSSPAVAQNQIILLPNRIDDASISDVEFLLNIEVDLDDPAAEDVSEITASFGSTVLMLEDDGDSDWESKVEFEDFESFQVEVDGTWTFTIVGGTLASTSTFTFDASSLSNADFFDTPPNLNPADGSTGVSPEVVLSWEDSTSSSIRSPDALVAELDANGPNQNANSLVDEFDPSYISIDATSWTPQDSLEDGLVEFSVLYVSVDAGLVSTIVVVPELTISWDPPDFYPVYPSGKAFLGLGSKSIVDFSVPEPSATTLELSALATLGLLAARPHRQKDFHRKLSSAMPDFGVSAKGRIATAD